MSSPLIIYVHDLRVSGVVGNALNIARAVAQDREVIVAAGASGPVVPDVSPARLVVFHANVAGRFGKYAAIRPLRRLIRDCGAGVVLSAGNLGHRAVLWASRGTGVKSVFRISNAVGRPSGGWINFIRRYRHRELIRSATRLILVGQSFRKDADYRQAIEGGKAIEIANGVDVQNARARAEAASPHPWLDDELPVVLGIGRLHPQKNFATLIEASALAMSAHPHRLIILGSGPDEQVQTLRDQADAAGIGERFLLAGHAPNVFPWLKRASLFALISKWEGSSNALLEAMAVGTPILASRQAGDAVEVLAEGRYGVLVDGHDPAAIATGIVRQLRDPIFPGLRADDYRIEDTMARYRDVLASL